MDTTTAPEFTGFETELGNLLLRFPAMSMGDVTKATRKVLRVIEEVQPQPLRGKGAYQAFVKAELPKVKEMHPLMPPTERMKEVGRRWRELKGMSG
jgi:hypothetical protein